MKTLPEQLREIFAGSANHHYIPEILAAFREYVEDLIPEPRSHFEWCAELKGEACDCGKIRVNVMLTELRQSLLSGLLVEPVASEDKHKIGEHGAIGKLTQKGRVCLECNELVEEDSIQ